MTAFDTAWRLVKSDMIRAKMERVLTPEEIRSITQENYDMTRGNLMVWDHDMTAMFPRECSKMEGKEGVADRYCPHGSTITDFTTGIPEDDKYGMCSICLNPWIDDRHREQMAAEGYFGLPPDEFKEYLEGVERGDEPDESTVDFSSVGRLDQKRFRDNLEGYE